MESPLSPAGGAGDRAPSLAAFALAAAASSLLGREAAASEAPEARYLFRALDLVRRDGAAGWPAALDAYLAAPSARDERLIRLRHQLNLSKVELLSAALAAAVEFDVMAGRAMAFLQAPIGGSRPTLGLLSTLLSGLDPNAFETILRGPALAAGLLTLQDERLPLPERPVAVPPELLLALGGGGSAWPNATLGAESLPEVVLPESVIERAARHAKAIAAEAGRSLVIRTPSPLEGRWVAAHVCAALGRRPLFLGDRQVRGLAPFLLMQDLLPVFCLEAGPGEREMLPVIPCYDGPVLAVCGVDGTVEASGGAPLVWRLEVPAAPERRDLWRRALPKDEALAEELSHHHRHGAGRIAYLGRLAHHESALRGAETPGLADVVAASWSAEALDLEALAEPLPRPVGDEALVLPPHTRADMELLYQRCRSRDGLAEGLGASITARYHPGVRALLTGPSGSGKTLATGWLATRLGIPLFRVDLSSVISKYIGETEKNLALLLARAEQADVMLLFDEADSLFGKRTDVKEANDRFANSQTNYLLQRIESFDGIAVLTSNSRSRFDSAFARRLDAIIEFAMPGPDERRALWLSHLGEGHDLTARQVNLLAAAADLGGGHIRNAVLTAAVLAYDPPRPIAFADVLEGVAVEYRKLGRQLPVELKTAGEAGQ